MVITMKETIVYGKTIALALKRGAEELGVDEAKAEYEVLEEPKKGFFCVGASDAKLRVFISRLRQRSRRILCGTC